MTTDTAPALASNAETTYAGNRARTARRLVLHYVEMLVAMLAGMVLLGPLVTLLVPHLTAHTEAHALVMATEMTAGMAAWMRVRRHSGRAIAEMSAAMYVPFLALLVPYWAGALSGDAVLTWGHVLMLPAMAVPMVLRRHDHAG